MPEDSALRHGTSIKIDLRKVSRECKLPYTYAHVVFASRVGIETAVEFGSLNQNEIAAAVQNKEPEAELEVTLHARVMLSPTAVFNLRKQMDAIADALLKENPQWAQLAEIAQ